MAHILVAGKLHRDALALLSEAEGVSFDYVEEVSEEAYTPFLRHADALLLRTQPLQADAIAGAGSLKIVSRHGVGFDAVDVAALNARGIVLAVVGDVNSVSVAEHTMALLLAASKRLLRADRAVRAQGQWHWRNRLEPRDLAGKSLLLIGYGRIGQRVARMAAAFGMEVAAHDPWRAGQGWPEDAVARPAPDLAEALARAEAVSVHVPFTGRPVLGAAELALLRPGAIVINTARGGVVDEQALADALASGRIGAAGLDVFGEEPPAPDHPLMRFDQVILTPHMAGLTEECARRMGLQSVRNILDFLAGNLDPAFIVNREALHV